MPKRQESLLECISLSQRNGLFRHLGIISSQAVRSYPHNHMLGLTLILKLHTKSDLLPAFPIWSCAFFSSELLSGEFLSGGFLSGEFLSGELLSGELLSDELLSGEFLSGEILPVLPCQQSEGLKWQWRLKNSTTTSDIVKTKDGKARQ